MGVRREGIPTIWGRGEKRYQRYGGVARRDTNDAGVQVGWRWLGGGRAYRAGCEMGDSEVATRIEWVAKWGSRETRAGERVDWGR